MEALFAEVQQVVNDAEQGRVCTACLRWKPASEYQHRNRSGRGLRPVSKCRECQRRKMRKFGITLEEYDAMLAAQNGLCAICPNPPVSGQGRRYGTGAVDHDHATGRVRGILCDRCNTLLGQVDDDPALLQRAIDYLAGSAEG